MFAQKVGDNILFAIHIFSNSSHVLKPFLVKDSLQTWPLENNILKNLFDIC